MEYVAPPAVALHSDELLVALRTAHSDAAAVVVTYTLVSTDTDGAKKHASMSRLDAPSYVTGVLRVKVLHPAVKVTLPVNAAAAAPADGARTVVPAGTSDAESATVRGVPEGRNTLKPREVMRAFAADTPAAANSARVYKMRVRPRR